MAEFFNLGLVPIVGLPSDSENDRESLLQMLVIPRKMMAGPCKMTAAPHIMLAATHLMFAKDQMGA